MKCLSSVALLLLSAVVFPAAQTIHQAKALAIPNNASNEMALKSNGGALLSLLKPRSAATVTAEKPFIKYFWELGDGEFSTNENPQHSYAIEENRKVRLFMTPCYTLDKIKPDSLEVKTRKGTIAMKSSNEAAWSGNIRMTSNLTLHNIKVVRSNDVFVGIASFRNPLNIARNAKLFIFYNKKNQVKTVGKVLALKDARLHGSTEGVLTQETPAINALRKDFYDAKVFKINNLDKTPRNVFFTFEVAGKAGFEKVKDLDIVAALLVDNTANVEQNVLSFKTASSFDPNNIKAPGTMSFRHVKNKTFKYRINFENIGNSPATSVKVKTDIPDALDAFSIHNLSITPAFKNNTVKDSAMKYVINPDGKFITFDFTDIDISGAKEDWKPKKKDTQGFIEYELKPKKDIRKRTLESGAEIIFDQNKPIVTDKDRTPFRRGLSIGAKAGVSWQPNTEGYNYFIGGTYSAYKPDGFYNQIEIMTDLNKRYVSRDSQTISGRTDYSPPINAELANFKDTVAFIEKYSFTNSIRLVPLNYRYDFPFVSIGLGLNADISFVKEQTYREVTEYKYQDGSNASAIPCYMGRTGPETRKKTTVEYGGFADMAFGNYSTGMSVGLRLNQTFKKQGKPFLQLYLSYKIL